MNVSDFTNKDIYSRLRTYLFSHSASLNINGVEIPVENFSRLDKILYPNAVEPGKKIVLDKYCTPSSVVLQTYEKVGKEIEKSIQCAFLLQMFNIKGTDLLCAAFCFIISLLPCDTRNDIYLALQEISSISSESVTGARAVNDLANTALSVIDIGSDIANTVSGMASGKESSTTGVNLNSAEKIATMLAVPANIVSNVKLILSAMQLAKGMNFLEGDLLGRNLWDIAQSIMQIVQCMVLQMIDELLNKLITPIENFLKDLTPGICFGTMADAIRQKIIRFIRSLKSKLLAEIADFMTSNKAYNIKFRANQKQCGWSIELVAMIEVINYIVQDFVAIARACGVSPCSTSGYTFKLGEIQDTDGDTINPFTYYTPDSATEIEKIPDQVSNIDDLADKISNYTNVTTTVTPDTIQSISDIANNAPDYIKNLINNGILNNILDSNYNVVNTDDGIKVVYTFNKGCRED